MLGTNCYIIRDEDELALIDPAVYSDKVYNALKELGGKLKYILLTHGHYDHIGGVKQFQELFPDAKTYIGKNDEKCLTDDYFNLSSRMAIRNFPHFSAELLSNGDVLNFGSTKIRFMETPGHTAGSGCYIADDCIFSGDTLFRQSCGRTDFPDSSPSDMLKSLIRLSRLKGVLRVFPGHGEFSTLDYERNNNPYMSQNYEDIY